MDTWDNAQPDRDRPIGGGPALPEAGSERLAGAVEGTASVEGAAAEPEPGVEAEPDIQPESREPSEPPEPSEPSEPSVQSEFPELHRVLSAVADAILTAPPSDMYPKVMARATRIRRRRRAIRASSATAVLAVAAVLGPSIASELGVRGGDASAAPPPSAIVDLTSAYPVPEQLADTRPAAPTPTQPENALAWPSRGAAVPAQAVDVAKSYLLNHAKNAPSSTTATVTTLWAQIDEDTTAPTPVGHGVAPKPVSQNAHKTWLYVMQGWTTAPDGTPSPAQLLVGDYTQAGKASSMSVYAAPVTFAHARPGSTDDTDDARQIAELSVWLPESNRLVVLGAPQTETVLYAKTGGDLIPEPTTDGVAIFQRTRRLVKGRYADAIQVRDANNVALTPPKAWSAADFQLTGAESLWRSAGGASGGGSGGIGGGGASSSGGVGGGWVTLPARSGSAHAVPVPMPSTPVPSVPAPNTKPGLVPTTEPVVRPTAGLS